MNHHKSIEFDEDLWLSENQRFNEDLQWILGLNFHRLVNNICGEANYFIVFLSQGSGLMCCLTLSF